MAGPPWQILVPLALGALSLLTWLLGVATFVRVQARQTITHGPLIAYAGSPPIEKYDAVGFSVTNRSLLHPVFLRRIGAEGREPAGVPVQVEAWLESPPMRLEARQDQLWEMSFGDLADHGIDLRKGVRGWAIIDGRAKPYRSRWVSLRATGNRLIPAPTPRLRPSE